MGCRDFRRQAGADPGHLGADAAAHRDACPSCAEYLRQTLALDDRILAALRIPVPAPRRVIPFPVIDRRRLIALAASIAAGVMVGSLLWVSGPTVARAGSREAHGPRAACDGVVRRGYPVGVAEVLDKPARSANPTCCAWCSPA